MSEKYDLIIENVDKYYYFIVSPNKTILLSSSDNLKDVEEKALSKLKPKINTFIGKKLVFVKIINTYKKFKSENTLGLIGGPIAFEFMSGLVENKNKIKNEKETGNNKYYLSKKYIKENINNISKDLNLIVKKYLDNLTENTFMDINVI
jgi:hypothetical protein